MQTLLSTLKDHYDSINNSDTFMAFTLDSPMTMIKKSPTDRLPVFADITRKAFRYEKQLILVHTLREQIHWLLCDLSALHQRYTNFLFDLEKQCVPLFRSQHTETLVRNNSMLHEVYCILCKAEYFKRALLLCHPVLYNFVLDANYIELDVWIIEADKLLKDVRQFLHQYHWSLSEEATHPFTRLTNTVFY
jgi:hypothetical protein